MQQKIFKEKYPIFELTFDKDEARFQSVAEIMNYLYNLVEEHPIALNIARFDHYQHTKSIGGEIGEGIEAAQNLVFCFGMELPSPDPVAVRPRSIGVTDLGDRFVVNFMEAPVQAANETMEKWAKSLVK